MQGIGSIPVPWVRSLLLWTVLVCSAATSHGQFSVIGRLRMDGGDLSNARVIIYKNGEKERTITTGLNKFKLDLDLQANYLVTFEKPGFVTKKLSFDTHVPVEVLATAFTPFEFSVALFKQYDDMNLVVFNQPVGVIRYDAGLGDLDYDTDYTKSIQAQLQQAQAEVDKKRKEETDRQSSAAKQEAKAAEESRKQAAQERVAAQRKAEEDRLAAKREADEEAKRKAEEERKAASDARAAEAEQLKEQRLQQAEAKHRAEEEKRVALERSVAETPPPPIKVAHPPAVPPVKAPTPPAARKVPTHSDRPAVRSEGISGGDPRRNTAPVEGRDLRTADTEQIGNPAAKRIGSALDVEILRNEELIVEPNKVITIVTVETDGRRIEYRKVIHKWGGVFYFRDGDSVSQTVYQTEALGEHLVNAAPKGR